MNDKFICCPECGEPKSNIKRFVLFSYILFLLIGARFKTSAYICCSGCMRKRIIRNTFNLNILSANVLWLIVILPWNIIAFLCTFISGHSRHVINLLNSSNKT